MSKDLISQIGTGMVRCRYTGPDVGWNVKAGMTALVQADPSNASNVRVQFDDYHAQRAGVDLAFGWHPFPADQWEVAS